MLMLRRNETHLSFCCKQTWTCYKVHDWCEWDSTESSASLTEFINNITANKQLWSTNSCWKKGKKVLFLSQCNWHLWHCCLSSSLKSDYAILLCVCSINNNIILSFTTWCCITGGCWWGSDQDTTEESLNSLRLHHHAPATPLSSSSDLSALKSSQETPLTAFM